MTELLTSQEVIDKLHQDHLRSKKFMNEVAEVVEPIYDIWQQDHGWQEVPSMEKFILPSLWPALDKNGELYPEDTYPEICKEKRISQAHQVTLEQHGLRIIMTAAENADLYSEPNISGLEAHSVYGTEMSILSRAKLVPVKAGFDDGQLLGEVILTNIGKGNLEAYYALHDARTRCAKFIAVKFHPALQKLAAAREYHTDGLARAVLGENRDEFERPGYNPLMHTMLEGMMTTGQAVNYLVQAGIEGQTVLLDDMKKVLRNHLPAILSRTVINAHIGPNQMAGLSVKDAVVRSDRGLMIKPSLLADFRRKRDSERASLAHMNDDDLEFMNRADVQTVSRFEGCPANRLVRLTDRMLLAALSAA